MRGSFSEYLDEVGRELSPEFRKLLRGDLYVVVLHWYTDGLTPKEAANRIRKTADAH